jgi:hypothetical protein
VESIELARKANRPPEPDAVETVRSALVRLPLAVLSHGSALGSLAALADGRLASGGRYSAARSGRFVRAYSLFLLGP